MPVVSSEHANAKRNLEVLQNKKSTLQDKLNRYREEIGKITSRKNALQEDKMKIGQDLQQKQVNFFKIILHNVCYFLELLST